MFHIKHRPSKSSRPHSQKSIDSALHELNARIDRLGENTLPKQPYLLSVPSDVPYRHSSRFVNTWHVGTPFRPREEQLQYVSFLPHQEEDEELLRVEGGWWDDHGQPFEELSPKSTYNSGRNTPSESTHRKKISLKDYKTKGKMSTPPSGNLTDISSSLKQTRNQTNMRSTEVKEDKPSQSREPTSTTSPKTAPSVIPALDGAASPRSPPEEHGYSPRPTKRRKLSPSLESRAQLATAKEKSNEIPQLLSPTLPSPKRDTTLPELLSPLLPPTLAKAIATPPSSGSHERNHSHQRSDSVRSILASAIGESSPRASEKNGNATGTLGANRPRSESQHSVRSNMSGTNANKPLAQTKSMTATSKDGTPVLSVTRSPGPRQRHTIALKYGKKNRKRVEALLKLAPRSKKTVPKQGNSSLGPKAETRQPQVTKEVSKPKVVVDHSSEPPQKPKSANTSTDNLHRPSTPVPSKIKESTNTLSPSMAKSTYSTPKKELKSAAMRRVESTDGGDPATPGERPVSTPLGNDRGSIPPKTSPAPSSTPSTKDEDRQGWLNLKDTYFQLGRTLKHEGTALDKQETDPSKSLALLVEALICFMINLATQACARPNVDPGWRTILLYHIFVFRASRKIPVLHGLVVQLGAVCRQLIHKHDMDRLGRDPLPDDHLGSAPTPGSDGNTKTNEDGEKYKKKYLAFRDELVQNTKELQTAWMDGSRQLSPEVLQREFPKTWSQRSKDYRSRGAEKPSPAKMGTGYFLPLDSASSAFEAAQFGLALMGEWANAEEVDWRPRVEL